MKGKPHGMSLCEKYLHGHRPWTYPAMPGYPAAEPLKTSNSRPGRMPKGPRRPKGTAVTKSYPSPLIIFSTCIKKAAGSTSDPAFVCKNQEHSITGRANGPPRVLRFFTSTTRRLSCMTSSVPILRGSTTLS
jgi:hypothetical protein